MGKKPTYEELEKMIRDLKQAESERKRTEKALRHSGARLRESEEKYRSMMEALDDAIYISLSDFRIKYMNPTMVKRIGCDPEITCAQVIIDGIKFKTKNFKKTKWKLAYDIIIYGERVGTMEVYCNENRKPAEKSSRALTSLRGTHSCV
ncbi:MAG: hypothetical protein HN931_06210 [Desulfobacterales bacterium]|jgi:PAS domain-containing protein|nr:hypothetical protein [Desulfobacteraceae bacterium]MBT7085749.1 hypothetical protein [Desulfobacterales bacterium]